MVPADYRVYNLPWDPLVSPHPWDGLMVQLLSQQRWTQDLTPRFLGQWWSMTKNLKSGKMTPSLLSGQDYEWNSREQHFSLGYSAGGTSKASRVVSITLTLTGTGIHSSHTVAARSPQMTPHESEVPCTPAQDKRSTFLCWTYCEQSLYLLAQPRQPLPMPDYQIKYKMSS